jgi:phosphoglycerate dehydrogenase-like enzyme
MASPRALWRVPADVVQALRDAAPEWDVVEIGTPAPSDGDGGVGSPEAVAATKGAEIYLGYGVPSGVAAAGRGTLRWAHSAAAGVGASLAPLRGTGITLTNSAGIHAEPMADWVLAAVAYFSRGLDQMVAAQASRRWAKGDFTDRRPSLPELRDLRVGIVGLGGIGSAVAARMTALGMRVAGVRRRPQRGAPPGVSWVGGLDQLARLAGESDVLVIAAPLTSISTGTVSRNVLESLPPGAVVVNVSRGGILDEAALLELLDAGRLRGAALDVFATEPLPADHPFWRHPAVLVSPHVSAVTERFWARELGLILGNLRRYLEGEPLINVVDLEAGY